MRTGFEINGDYRLMDSAELVYILTNSAVMVNKVQEKEIAYGENCNFEEVLAKMTPGKRNLVMAGVELYKRCNSKKNEKPQIKCSTDIYDIMHPYLCDKQDGRMLGDFFEPIQSGNTQNQSVGRWLCHVSGGCTCHPQRSHSL